MVLVEEINEVRQITLRQMDEYVKVRNRLDAVDHQLAEIRRGQGSFAKSQNELTTRQAEMAGEVSSIRIDQAMHRRDLKAIQHEMATKDDLRSELAMTRAEMARRVDLHEVWSEMATQRGLDEGLAAVRSEMATQRGLDEGLAAVRSEMKDGLQEVRSEMKDGLQEVRSEMQELRAEMLTGLKEIRDLVS